MALVAVYAISWGGILNLPFRQEQMEVILEILLFGYLGVALHAIGMHDKAGERRLRGIMLADCSTEL
jgi:hypothetical protein